MMMLNCFKKFCLQGDPLSMEERGEWMQPVRNDNARHVAPVAERSRDSITVDHKGMQWDDVVSNMDNMRLSELNVESTDGDKALMDALETARDSGVEGTLGRISMGSMYMEDSVMRGLGAKNLSIVKELSGIEDEEEGKGNLEVTQKDDMRLSELNVESTDGDKALMDALETARDSGVEGTLGRISMGSMYSEDSVMRGLGAKVSIVKELSGIEEEGKGNLEVTQKQLRPAITSVTALGNNGYFLTASRHEGGIKMYKLGEKKYNDDVVVEFVKKFEGHTSGVTDIVAFCSKGRFLSAGVDGDVILWDSRVDVIDEDSDDAETGMPLERVNILAKFNYFEIQQVAVLDEGSFVRTTHGIDQCTGSFITSSPNESEVQIWSITKEKKTYDEYANQSYVADMSPFHELEHNAPIESIAAMTNSIILTGDVVGDVHVWGRGRRRSTLFGNKSNWTKSHKLTPWKSDIVRTPEEMGEQSVQALCFLDNNTFVSGTKSGTVRVWNEIKANTDFVVHKSHSSSVKVTSKPVTDIRKLPLIKDPSTAEVCMAFSASFADGRMASMALYPDNPGDEVMNNELVMFHVYRNSSSSSIAAAAAAAATATEHARSENAINAIAVLEAGIGRSSGNNNNNNGSSFSSSSFDPVVIAGDENGSIQTLKPKWNSLSASV